MAKNYLAREASSKLHLPQTGSARCHSIIISRYFCKILQRRNALLTFYSVRDIFIELILVKIMRVLETAFKVWTWNKYRPRCWKLCIIWLRPWYKSYFSTEKYGMHRIVYLICDLSWLSSYKRSSLGCDEHLPCSFSVVDFASHLSTGYSSWD